MNSSVFTLKSMHFKHSYMCQIQKFFSCFLFLSITSLWAYQPLRWSPIDEYVLRDKLGGPLGLRSYDVKGKLIESIKYEYNSKGRLVKENYYNAQNVFTGYLEYEYKKSLLHSEKLYNTKGALLSSVIFEERNGHIHALSISNQQGELISKQNFSYEGKNIVGGSERENEQTTDFKFFYEKGILKKITLFSKTSGKLAEILFKYDSNNRIIERTRHLYTHNQSNKCIYLYDSKKERILNYRFETLIDANTPKESKGSKKQNQPKWVLEKSISLFYKDTQ